MFVIDVKKAKPTITQMEPLITSNSINAFSVQFIFSEEWDGMQRFAVFKTPQSDPMQILLDDTNICDIPWELLEEDGPKVLVGAYGLKDDGKEVRLPTIWIAIDSISEGVLEGYEVSDPTPDIYSQFIEALNRLQKPGTTFTPYVSDEGDISWTNDGEKENPETVNVRGATFTPSVSDEGDISWTNDKGKTNPETINVRGATFTPEVSDDGTVSWTNDKGKLNPNPVNVRGATFTPSVSEDGDIIWTNDKGKANPETVNVRGATFMPSVSDEGDISWTNDKGKVNPETKNIKGPKGDTGTIFTPSVDEDGNLSWSNNDGKDNPETINIRGPQGLVGPEGPVGPPSSIFVTAPIGAILIWEKPDEIPTGWAKYEDSSMPELPEGTCYIRKETVDEDDIDFIPGETLTLSKESILNVKNPIPDGGVAGQVATKTSDGIEWKDPGTAFELDDTLSLDDGTLGVKKPNQGVYTREEFEALSEDVKSKGLFVVLEDDNGTSGGQSVPQKSLYEQFVEHGYTGTEDDFNALIASGPWLPTSGGEVHGDISFSKAENPDDVVMSVDNESINGYVPMYMNNHQIKGVSTPSASTDAANKQYVDDTIGTRQTKLIGSQGQLVSFDASGNAIAQNAPESMTSADLDIWSTTERVVGTWYDGRPIYEKGYYLNNHNFGTTLNGGTSGAKTMQANLSLLFDAFPDMVLNCEGSLLVAFNNSHMYFFDANLARGKDSNMYSIIFYSGATAYASIAFSEMLHRITFNTVLFQTIGATISESSINGPLYATIAYKISYLK